MGTAMPGSSHDSTSFTASEKEKRRSLSSGNWLRMSSVRARAVSTEASSFPALFMEALWSTRMPKVTWVLWMASKTRKSSSESSWKPAPRSRVPKRLWRMLILS
jgi:hypothetical protein